MSGESDNTGTIEMVPQVVEMVDNPIFKQKGSGVSGRKFRSTMGPAGTWSGTMAQTQAQAQAAAQQARSPVLAPELAPSRGSPFERMAQLPHDRRGMALEAFTEQLVTNLEFMENEL